MCERSIRNSLDMNFEHLSRISLKLPELDEGSEWTKNWTTVQSCAMAMLGLVLTLLTGSAAYVTQPPVLRMGQLHRTRGPARSTVPALSLYEDYMAKRSGTGAPATPEANPAPVNVAPVAEPQARKHHANQYAPPFASPLERSSQRCSHRGGQWLLWLGCAAAAGCRDAARMGALSHRCRQKASQTPPKQRGLTMTFQYNFGQRHFCASQPYAAANRRNPLLRPRRRCSCPL